MVKINEEQNLIDAKNRPEEKHNFMNILKNVVITKKGEKRRDELARKDKKRLGDAAGLTLIQKAIYDAES